LREGGAPEELLAALSNVDAQVVSAGEAAGEAEDGAPVVATWWVARAPSGERMVALVTHDPILEQDRVEHAVILPPGAASIADIPRKDLAGFLRAYPRAIEELPLLLAPQSAQPPPAVPGFRELDPNHVRAAAARLVGYRLPAAALARVLAAWGAANKVSPLSVADILKAALPNAPQSELEAAYLWVERAYLGAGADLSNVRDELARALGLGAPPQGGPPEPGGAATLVGLLMGAGAVRESALFAALELQRALGPHPVAGAVFVEIDRAAGLYAVVDLEAWEVYRAYATVDPRTKAEAFALRDVVIAAAPVEVVVHVDPESGEPRYAARWIYGGGDRRELAVGPSTSQEMLARLAAGGRVWARRLAEDFLSAVLGFYHDSGLARVEALPAAPGFYWAEGKLVAAGVRVDPPAPEELRAAWELLDELATKWWGHAQAKFASMLRWAAGAPFHYAVKQGALGRPAWVGYVFLHGPPDTGKSELARVLCYDLWGLEAEMESGATVDTVARLGRVLERWTFPTVVNEVSHLFREDRHEELVNMIKNAAERTVARGRYYGGTEYREVRARSPLVLTSNAMPLNDPAFLKRFALVIGFTYSEVVPRERQEQYNREVRPRLRALEAIGRYVAARVLREGIPADLDFGRLLKESYREAFGAEPPAWLDLEAERGEEGPSVDEFRRAVLTFIVVEVNNAYRQYHKMDEVNRPTLRERAESVLREWYIPWIRAARAQGGEEVRIYDDVLKALGGAVPGATSLRALADLMGWKYDPRVAERRGERVTTVKAIRVPLNEFLAELEPVEVDEGAAGLQ
ncbi:MAG: hypothetical protein RXR82_08745, partial [Nitrososphaeria archaeon]